jgi:flagellar biosynthetic protein FliP
MSLRAAVVIAVALAGPIVAAEPADVSADLTSRPLPLAPMNAAPADGVAPRSPRPLADWRLLAAIAAGVGLLVVVRALGRQKAAPLPPDVFEVLGSGTLGGPHAVRVVRFGPKTLLVGVSAAGTTTLAELADPQATARIAAACRGGQRPAGAARPVVPIAGAVLLAVLASAAGATAAEPEPAAAAVGVAPASAAPAAATPAATDSSTGTAVPAWLAGRSLEALLPSALAIGVMSLAPAVLLMTTCFVRMSVVLALLRQGLGTAQIPSNQIVAALAIFLSAMVMWPVWTQAWREGVEPYRQGTLAPAAAFDRGTLPIRRWMAAQIEQAGNRDTMLLFLERHPAGPRAAATYDDVPVETLLPAFLVSELETAFTIGFRMLVPFLVLDVLVATLVVSTGLVMLPPTLVSLPLKLLVFVAADGWTLVIRALLDGVRVAAA